MRSCSKHLYDVLSGFAQKMSFFRHCSGLTLSSILQFLLPMVPSIRFEKLGFDIHDPFASAGLRFVSHPENTTFRKRKKTEGLVPRCGDEYDSTAPNLDPSAGSSSGVDSSHVVKRIPEVLYHLDHRFVVDNYETSKTFYCDLCWKPCKYLGSIRPYDGNFVNKTWNLDEDPENHISRAAVLQGWKEGIYDLSWHCLWCHAESLGRSNDLRGVARDMDLWRQYEERTRHKKERQLKYQQKRRC